MVAEKFEAMVKLGVANSRMKDFYDLWVLARRFEFDSGTLAAAIQSTFKTPRSRVFTGFLKWCREGESNPQDPKVGGF